MTLNLPYPPSANRYWRLWRGRAVKSTEAKSYQRSVGLLARAAGVKLLHGEVRVTIDVVRPIKRGDLDNSLKVLFDALNGILWEDDSQIVEIHASRYDNKDRPGVMLQAVEI